MTGAAPTIERMALSVGDREIRPLTADEVMRMVDAGILGEDDRVELLHGLLTAVSPKSPEHGAVIARLTRWLTLVDAAGRYEVLSEHPLVVPDATSLPEPDIAVVERRGDVTRHPRTALLVVEVAPSSIRIDLQLEPALYAAAGVPEYWVVDVPRRRVELFSGPTPGRGYERRGTLEPPATLTFAGAPLDLASVFEGL